MRRGLSIGALWLALAVSVCASTLERLGLDEMVEKSTAILRCRVVSSRASVRGPLIYTLFTVQVLEHWKGGEDQQVEVAVPGGVADGMRQAFAGAPELAPGSEYVLFLWKGQSGLRHVIGLSQGVFRLSDDGKGGLVALRSASSEAMLDAKTGRIVNDVPVRMGLGELRSRVSSTLRSGGN